MRHARPKSTKDRAIGLDLPETDSHYLGRVSSVGDKESVIANSDIYSNKGVLLLKKGTSINRKAFTLLSKHKLATGIDSSISMADQLTNRAMYIDYQNVMAEPFFHRLMPCINNPLELKNCIRRIPLTETLRNKLSVARKSHSDGYVHGIRVSLAAAMLGYFQGLSQGDCESLAAAGLFHDLGMLHLDPSLLDSGLPLGAPEMRYVQSHPLIIYLMLKDSEAYHPHISVPVLEHHERRAGHGYPQGLAEFTSPLSSVLAMAEVLVSMMERVSMSQVLEVIKVQQDMFDVDTVKALFKVAQQVKNLGAGTDQAATHDNFCDNVQRFGRICGQWLTVMPEVERMAGQEPQAAKLLNWMRLLERMLIRAGVDSGQIQQLSQPEFKDLWPEYQALINEGLFHLKQIIYSLTGYCDKHPQSSLATSQLIRDWMLCSDRELQAIWQKKYG